MIKSYFKIALRQLARDKTHSFINIAGLSVGMTVTLLIGLWIRDELRYDHFPPNYARIAQVMQNKTINGNIKTNATVPVPLADELQKSYGSDFRYIVLASWNWKHILSAGDKNLSQAGRFMGPDAPNLFALNMLKGSRTGLNDPSSILLSQTLARALFGDADPMDKTVSLDNKSLLHVSGIYQDFPSNASFRDVGFIAPWDLFAQNELRPETKTDWNDDSYQLFVQIADHADMLTLSARIKEAKSKKIDPANARYKPSLFLQPMDRWHLYSEFTNGVNTGGRIQYVWLFGVIGVFVLLLACINFMNLSTARSERRAKEVGIRKAIGSVRGQLIVQFFCESLLMAVLAFVIALLLALLALPFFNGMADKKMSILWDNPWFWLLGLGFSLFTGLMAGSYPALYLSSFRPVKVLKGVFTAGRNVAIPRRVLVVVQFTVSVVLIIGTIIVFQQIRYAMDRPVGYRQEGLITVETATDGLSTHFLALRDELLRSGMVSEVASSNSATTGISFFTSNIDWKGKDPGMTIDFATVGVTSEYGKTVGWEIKEGRDFSGSLQTDSTGSAILNEAAVKYMGLTHPVGEMIKRGHYNLRVVGVIKDMVMESPYQPVKQTIYYVRKPVSEDYIDIRIRPGVSTATALSLIGSVCRTLSPSEPFTYKFVEEEYARKFSDEGRIGRLAGCFAVLAVFISCLGLFGMAAFMAGQRIREIGIRKVMGASVFSLWRLLSKEFVALVTISLLIAIPIAHYVMGIWLRHYQYRSGMPWWIFAAAAGGALLITLLTVSYQGIHAAIMNPVKSLRAE